LQCLCKSMLLILSSRIELWYFLRKCSDTTADSLSWLQKTAMQLLA